MLSSIPADSILFLHKQENITLLRAGERLLSASRSSVKCCKQYALTASTARLWRRHASVIVPLPQLFVIDKKLALLTSDITSQSSDSAKYISAHKQTNRQQITVCLWSPQAVNQMNKYILRCVRELRAELIQ